MKQNGFDKFAKAFKKASDKFTQDVTVEVFDRIAVKHPVLTGLSVGDWTVTTDNPSLTQKNSPDPQKTRTRADIRKKVPKESGHKVYLSNNIDYTPLLEGVAGPQYMSRKAPEGMVAVTFDQMDEIVSDALKGGD